MNIDAMEAGGTLDRLVTATIILPDLWLEHRGPYNYIVGRSHDGREPWMKFTDAKSNAQRYTPITLAEYDDHKHILIDGIIKPYSTDIAAAWEVVEKMRTPVMSFRDGRWRCAIGNGRVEEEVDIDSRTITHSEGCFVGTGATAPLAICRAALKVVGK